MKSARISTFSNATTTTTLLTPTSVTATSKPAWEVERPKDPPESSTEKSKYQIPFSVPALSGGLGNAQSKKSDEPPFKPADFGKSGGKVRTKLGDKAVDLEEHKPEPLPAHLSNPVSTGLDVKQLPNFGFLQTSMKPASSVSKAAGPLTNSLSASSSNSSVGAVSNSSSKTADTLLLSPVKQNVSPASLSTLSSASTFKFAEPVSVAVSSTEFSLSTSAVNGDVKRFSFSEPVVVTIATGFASNQFAMPDLTTSVTSNASSKLNAGGVRPAQSLKTGSVLDILGSMYQNMSYKIIITFFCFFL
jgi:hypothetical protein